MNLWLLIGGFVFACACLGLVFLWARLTAPAADYPSENGDGEDR